MSNQTLDLDYEIINSEVFYPKIKFAGHHNIFINGTLNINEGATLNLSNSSKMEILNNGELFLDWGSTITGATPTTFAADQTEIPGDRIIATDGGIISTKTETQYNQDPGPAICISSSSEELWDGIFIQNTNEGDNYWFVNCNISGISKLTIEDQGVSQGYDSNLKLYLTDFHDAGSIVARDEHTLSIMGEDNENRCYIHHNHATPIIVYDSPVNIDWVTIEHNGYDSEVLINDNCNGMLLNYSASQETNILNTIIFGNSGCGIESTDKLVNIDYNTISENDKHGISTKGTFDDLKNTIIQNNQYAEYVGDQVSYTWAGNDNDISDDVIDPLYAYDQYVLMAHEWDEARHSIDVRGNTITPLQEDRYYPRWDAFRFDSPLRSENQMLYAALEEMKNKNYEDAEDILLQIIAEYPDSTEAASALRGLLFIENYTDEDYAGLRSYMDNIQVGEDTAFHKAKREIKIKSYMKEEEYITAIELLETIIADPPTDDALIYALIDEGYCYLQLTEAGIRDLPVECSIKPRSFDDYQQKVNDLKKDLSIFNLQSNNQQNENIQAIILSRNYPNPFNPSTTISFELSKENNSNTKLSIFNVKGQKVKTLLNEHLILGTHSVHWNGTDNGNRPVSSGIYFYKIQSGNETKMRKLLLIK